MKDHQLKELLLLVQRQQMLRDELLRRQKDLAQKVLTADVGRPRRTASVMCAVVTVLMLLLPSFSVKIYATVPDGRCMRTAVDRTVVMVQADQILEVL